MTDGMKKRMSVDYFHTTTTATTAKKSPDHVSPESEHRLFVLVVQVESGRMHRPFFFGIEVAY